MSKTITYLSFTIVFLILCINLGLYYTHQLPMSTLADDRMLDTLFNADALFYPALYKDIVQEGGIYNTWYFTPVPYFFPDMILYFIVHTITGNFYHALSLFFLTEAFFLLWTLYLIFSFFFSKKGAWYLTVFTFSAFYFFKTPVWLLQFLNGFHYGSFLIGLWVLYLIFPKIETNKFNFSYRLIIIGVIWLLIIASDRLYVLQWILPMFGALILMWIAGLVSWKHMLGLNFLGLVAIKGGKWLHDILIPNTLIHADANNPTLEFKRIPHNIEILKSIFSESMYQYRVSFIVMIIVLFLSILLVIRYKRVATLSKGKIVIFMSLMLQLMTIGSLLAFSMTTREVNARYFIPLFMIPWIYLPIFVYYLGFNTGIGEILRKINKSLVILLGMLFLCIALLWNARMNFIHQTWYTNYTTPWVQCVDKAIEEVNATKIVSQYWQSKNLYVLSEHNITVAQFLRDLRPYKWITTTRWYKDKYNMVLIDYGASENYYRLNSDLIEKKNGMPDKVWHCDKTEIWYYKNGLEL